MTGSGEWLTRGRPRVCFALCCVGQIIPPKYQIIWNMLVVPFVEVSPAAGLSLCRTVTVSLTHCVTDTLCQAKHTRYVKCVYCCWWNVLITGNFRTPVWDTLVNENCLYVC